MLACVGKLAPDFEAIAYCDGEFRTVKLSEYRGKWIILCFYPGDFTFVCPTELASIAAVYKNLQALEVEVLGVSTDSRFTHKIWQEEELTKMVPGGVLYPLVSDAAGQVGTQYGVFDVETGTDIRSRFIIDPDFVIRVMEMMTPEVGLDVSELIRILKGFQHNRATGEMIPSGWQPGKMTIQPDPEMAGRTWQIWKTEMAF